MSFTPSKSALRFLRSQGGAESAAPHQLTSSRKSTSNGVKIIRIIMTAFNTVMTIRNFRVQSRYIVLL